MGDSGWDWVCLVLGLIKSHGSKRVGLLRTLNDGATRC